MRPIGIDSTSRSDGDCPSTSFSICGVATTPGSKMPLPPDSAFQLQLRRLWSAIMLRLCGGLPWRYVLSDMLFESHRNMVCRKRISAYSRPIRPDISLRCALCPLDLRRRSLCKASLFLALQGYVGRDDSRKGSREIDESNFKLEHQELSPR